LVAVVRKQQQEQIHSQELQEATQFFPRSHQMEVEAAAAFLVVPQATGQKLVAQVAAAQEQTRLLVAQVVQQGTLLQLHLHREQTAVLVPLTKQHIVLVPAEAEQQRLAQTQVLLLVAQEATAEQEQHHP
jgi:hypothetical protein